MSRIFFLNLVYIIHTINYYIMGDAFFRFAIKFIIGVGTAVIMMLWAKRIDSLTKELDNYRANDTTMVVVTDTALHYYIRPL